MTDDKKAMVWAAAYGAAFARQTLDDQDSRQDRYHEAYAEEAVCIADLAVEKLLDKVRWRDVTLPSCMEDE